MSLLYQLILDVLHTPPDRCEDKAVTKGETKNDSDISIAEESSSMNSTTTLLHSLQSTTSLMNNLIRLLLRSTLLLLQEAIGTTDNRNSASNYDPFNCFHQAPFDRNDSIVRQYSVSNLRYDLMMPISVVENTENTENISVVNQLLAHMINTTTNGVNVVMNYVLNWILTEENEDHPPIEENCTFLFLLDHLMHVIETTASTSSNSNNQYIVQAHLFQYIAMKGASVLQQKYSHILVDLLCINNETRTEWEGDECTATALYHLCTQWCTSVDTSIEKSIEKRTSMFNISMIRFIAYTRQNGFFSKWYEERIRKFDVVSERLLIERCCNTEELCVYLRDVITTRVVTQRKKMQLLLGTHQLNLLVLLQDHNYFIYSYALNYLSKELSSPELLSPEVLSTELYYRKNCLSSLYLIMMKAVLSKEKLNNAEYTPLDRESEAHNYTQVVKDVEQLIRNSLTINATNDVTTDGTKMPWLVQTMIEHILLSHQIDTAMEKAEIDIGSALFSKQECLFFHDCERSVYESMIHLTENENVLNQCLQAIMKILQKIIFEKHGTKLLRILKKNLELKLIETDGNDTNVDTVNTVDTVDIIPIYQQIWKWLSSLEYMIQIYADDEEDGDEEEDDDCILSAVFAFDHRPSFQLLQYLIFQGSVHIQSSIQTQQNEEQKNSNKTVGNEKMKIWGSAASNINIQLSPWQPNDAAGVPINTLPEYFSTASLADQGIHILPGGSRFGPYELRPPNNTYNTYVVEDFLVTEGKWYWEVTIVDPSPCPQLGVVAYNANLIKDKNGVGDDARGWGFDGTRQTTWDAGSSTTGRKWKLGKGMDNKWYKNDVIGFALNVKKGSLKLSKNGQEYPGMSYQYRYR